MLAGTLQVPEVKEVVLSSGYFRVVSSVIRSELIKAACTSKPFYGGSSNNSYGVVWSSGLQNPLLSVRRQQMPSHQRTNPSCKALFCHTWLLKQVRKSCAFVNPGSCMLQGEFSQLTQPV